jgi:hypothetical protein
VAERGGFKLPDEKPSASEIEALRKQVQAMARDDGRVGEVSAYARDYGRWHDGLVDRFGAAELRLVCSVVLVALGLALLYPALSELRYPIAGLLLGIGYRIATESFSDMRMFRE